MAGLNFRISFESKNAERIPEITARLADFSIPLGNIIDGWAKRNKANKFNKGRGAESTGVQQSADSFWQPLTNNYMKQKRRQGYPDSLMVKTGSLLASLTNPDGFARFVGASQAVFGTPLDPEDAKKARYNWKKRQVVFLNLTDKLAIKAEIQNYLSLGDEYKELLFAQGMRSVSMRREMAQLDADFSDSVGNA